MWIFSPICRTGQLLVVFILFASGVFCNISRLILVLYMSLFCPCFLYQPQYLIMWTHFQVAAVPRVCVTKGYSKVLLPFLFLSPAKQTCLVQSVCVYMDKFSYIHKPACFVLAIFRYISLQREFYSPSSLQLPIQKSFLCNLPPPNNYIFW